MERAGLPALKGRVTNYELRIRSLRVCIATVFVSSSLFWSSTTFAQPSAHSDPSLFLEPNHFSVVKELQDRSLWLDMGYGKSIFRIDNTLLGLEGLAWSRLEAISNFRFPVQTVDYFFGAYAMWTVPKGDWRLRVSHISSHLVDGSDTTIVGGASSRYSREFVELRRAGFFGERDQYYISLGLRGYFHQVTPIESFFDVPACIVWRLLPFRQVGTLNMYAFASSGAGPVLPCYSAGVRLEHREPFLAESDLQLYYQFGSSWAGTDAGAKRSTINLQMDVRGF